MTLNEKIDVEVHKAHVEVQAAKVRELEARAEMWKSFGEAATAFALEMAKEKP